LYHKYTTALCASPPSVLSTDTDLYKGVEGHFNAGCIAIAGLTLLIWTHLTTLDDEIRYIWNIGAGLTVNKALFGAIRYFTTVEFGFVDILACEFA